MKRRNHRILSILLLACLTLQTAIPTAWAESAPVEEPVSASTEATTPAETGGAYTDPGGPR